jgi:hypothetical protein
MVNRNLSGSIAYRAFGKSFIHWLTHERGPAYSGSFLVIDVRKARKEMIMPNEYNDKH